MADNNPSLFSRATCKSETPLVQEEVVIEAVW